MKAGYIFLCISAGIFASNINNFITDLASDYSIVLTYHLISG